MQERMFAAQALVLVLFKNALLEPPMVKFAFLFFEEFSELYVL